MTVAQILEELKPLGKDSYKKVLLSHGVKEPFFGVKIEDLKKIQKRIKKDYQLALDLYGTGIYDARYLAGLIADDARMSKRNLQDWVEQADCSVLSEYTVPWVAAESHHGREVALEWIESKTEKIAAAGWSTLGGLVALRDDAELDVAELKRLLERIEKTIHRQPDRVRYAMNGFVISAGCYVKSLTEVASKIGKSIGKVTVDVGGTLCKVPYAPETIEKVRQRGTIGKKRKTVKC
ncbi:MAG TPA: DNA alkylation repair protein [Candidatus Polarisedimenticolia bacterium]|jgi:3-methyladenine DNA glycosylase AlkD|nr:DNA alkylation repair protein [Candidatus Polarisedimenticolia bacterium]